MLLFREESEKTVNIQKQLNDVLKEGAKNAGAEVNSLEQTYKKLTDKNIAEKERQALLDQANKQYPGYFNNLSTEDFLLGKAAGQYNKLRDAIIASSQAKAAASKIDEIAGKYLEREVEITERIKANQARLKGKFYDQTRTYVGQSGGGVYTVTAAEQRMGVEVALKRDQQELQDLRNQKRSEMNPLIDIANNNPFKKTKPDNTGTGNSPYNIPGSTASASSSSKPDKEDKLQKEIDDRIKREDTANKKLIELQRQNAEERINLIQDEYEREKQLIDLEEKNKLADVIIQKKDKIAEIDAIDALLSKTKNEKDRKALNDEKENYEKILTKLGEREITIKQTFQDKRLSLEEKHKTELLKKDQEFLQQKLALLQREENETIAKLTTVEEQKQFLQGKISNDELAKIKDWNDGKQAIQKYYQQESLNLQTAYLQELIKQLEQIPADAITPE
jgi:tubulin-specific chaperone A